MLDLIPAIIKREVGSALNWSLALSVTALWLHVERQTTFHTYRQSSIIDEPNTHVFG